MKDKDKKHILRFLDKTYEEAVSLMIYARDFFVMNGKRERESLTKQEMLIYTLACTTITTQLTSIMSWLLMCKAVQNDEVSIEDLTAHEFEIPEFNHEIYDENSCFHKLSQGIKDILDKSYNIYYRVKRMEPAVRQQLLVEAVG